MSVRTCKNTRRPFAYFFGCGRHLDVCGPYNRDVITHKVAWMENASWPTLQCKWCGQQFASTAA